jgi:hypothetical protein
MAFQKRPPQQQADRLAEGGVSARFARTLLQAVAAIGLDVDALLRLRGQPLRFPRPLAGKAGGAQLREPA